MQGAGPCCHRGQELEDFVLQHLDNKNDSILSKFVIKDLERVQMEVKDWHVYQNIVQALSQGRIRKSQNDDELAEGDNFSFNTDFEHNDKKVFRRGSYNPMEMKLGLKSLGSAMDLASFHAIK